MAAKSFQKSYDGAICDQRGVSKGEFNNFKNFVKEYLIYFFNCELDNRPTLLTKIFGMYKIQIKKDKVYYFIVMDNLYFGLDSPNLKTYDLKGSELNRFVQFPKKGTTLLDTNFKIDRNGEPIPVKADHKDYMEFAIHNDTLFLSRHRIIDYSMLLIMDEKKQLLKVGIIDYLREYTLDK